MSIEKVAVVGSGLMGRGIAQVAATSGQEVSLIDISDELLGKAVQKCCQSAACQSFSSKPKLAPLDFVGLLFFADS